MKKKKVPNSQVKAFSPIMIIKHVKNTIITYLFIHSFLFWTNPDIKHGWNTIKANNKIIYIFFLVLEDIFHWHLWQ